MFPQCPAIWRAKSCNFSGTVKTARCCKLRSVFWLHVKYLNIVSYCIVRVTSCHLSRISYELFTKCDTQCHTCALNISSWQLDKSDNLTTWKKFWTPQNVCHDMAHTTSPDPHCHAYPRTLSRGLLRTGTPNCLPWRKPFVVPVWDLLNFQLCQSNEFWTVAIVTEYGVPQCNISLSEKSYHVLHSYSY